MCIRDRCPTMVLSCQKVLRFPQTTAYGSQLNLWTCLLYTSFQSVSLYRSSLAKLIVTASTPAQQFACQRFSTKIKNILGGHNISSYMPFLRAKKGKKPKKTAKKFLIQAIYLNRPEDFVTIDVQQYNLMYYVHMIA